MGANIILGNNGFVWIYPVVENEEENTGGFTQNLEEVVCYTTECVFGVNLLYLGCFFSGKGSNCQNPELYFSFSTKQDYVVRY